MKKSEYDNSIIRFHCLEYLLKLIQEQKLRLRLLETLHDSLSYISLARETTATCRRTKPLLILIERNAIHFFYR